jgi:PDZ domain-containing protein
MMMGSRSVGAVLVAAVLSSVVVPGQAAITMRSRADAHSWPVGTDVVPFEFRDGLVLVRAALFSPSGRDTAGLLIMDTGAPDLALTAGVWNALNVDTVAVSWGYVQRIQRTLTALEMGSARVEHLTVGGVLVDSVLDRGVLGLFAPSFYEDRAVVIDYESRTLAVVNRRLTLVGNNLAASPGGGLGRLARIRRSRAQYDAILKASAVPLTFRRFKGGRIVVTTQVTEPAYAWRSQPLTLLLDTGASSCVIFEDAMSELVRPPSRWPVQHDVPVRTVLGRFNEDATLLPRLLLGDGSTTVEEDHVTTGVAARRSLPDIQGELPDPIHGLLGNTFLARFRIVLDYGNDVLWLEPRPKPSARSSDGIQVGLTLERLWGELRVVAVVRGSAAQEAGVRAGDVVVAIDHAPMNDIDAADAEARLRGEPGSAVVLALRRDRLERVYTLARRGRP